MFWTLLTATGLALAGCTADQSDQRESEPAVVMIDVDDMAAFTLPLDSYRLADGESAFLVADATTAVFDRCMEGFGFVYDLPTPVGRAVPRDNSRLYGIVDPGEAMTNGYLPDMPGTADPGEGSSPELPPSWYAIATGTVAESEEGLAVPAGGCMGEALRTIAAGAPTEGVDLALADRLAGEASDRAEQDSRVQAAFAEWSACMSRSGYDYRTPWDANNDPAWMDGGEPSQHHIAVATADVACKGEVDLVRIWASVHTAYELRAIEQNAAALALIAEYRQIELANAASILEGF